MTDRATIEFEPYHLNLLDESLWRHGERLNLTRKAFAVLCYLVQNAGQLVTRDDLFEAAWPEVHVSDDALTVCIREIRQVLGDQARSPQYIETARGRGYRFIVPVTVQSLITGADHRDQVADTPLPARPLMVAREAKLARLHHQFNKMLQGQRQMVLVSGEAGIGKTTLVDVFVSEIAMQGHVRIGRGQCIDHYGTGEAYLPLLDALGQLCRGDDGAHLLPILHQHAPSWLLQMPALLSSEEFDALEHRGREITPERMLRELAEAAETMALERPLVLVLEDLHWSDHATLDWLAFVARRRRPARLFVVGTY